MTCLCNPPKSTKIYDHSTFRLMWTYLEHLGRDWRKARFRDFYGFYSSHEQGASIVDRLFVEGIEGLTEDPEEFFHSYVEAMTRHYKEQGLTPPTVPSDLAE